MTSEAEVIRRATLEGQKVQFATLIDWWHLKNSELEKFQTYIGIGLVLRGDIVEDDSENGAVFTEQGLFSVAHDGG